MSVIVHGATGAQGTPVVAALRAAGSAVTALTRRAGARVPGARVVVVDATRPEALADAYDGADGVFIHLPLGALEVRERLADSIVAALERAAPARVVVSTSGAVVSDPGHPLAAPAGSALRLLLDGVSGLGLPHAVVEPRLFSENLLLPPVIDGVRNRGVLAYPLRADMAVSWASHLDVADAAALLLTDRADVTGVVGAGRLPGASGADLARALSSRLGRAIAYEAMAPAAFGRSIAPLFGREAADGVVALYTALADRADLTIDQEHSAQRLLGITPRPLAAWAEDVEDVGV